MNLDGEPTSSDEYFVTAHQIFECCGIESDSTLRVDSLMDKFTPFVKTNKAEFSFLKSLLDPDQCNPDISVTKLANALHQYSESHKSKMDLDESFNLRCGQAPQDSDSGISTDGLQLLEDLQCELKEKDRLALQLRSQLDYTDRQHEEAAAALAAERDSLRRHLNMLREENATLSHVRRDYDEACERLCASGLALDEAKRELEGLKRRARISSEQVATLEADKLSLQDLLAKSKDECHRINEMYAARQSALLEESETLAAQRADLTTRLKDQDEFMKQLLKEKLLLEMELKDTLNKSNQTQPRLDRSVDISYTEDQMLTVLDSLNADSRFSTENRILDNDSFMNALIEDQGRSTNMSLFDEIRMSFNMTRLNSTEFNTAQCSLNNSIITSATQTEDIEFGDDKNENSLIELKTFVATTQTEEIEVKTIFVMTQTEEVVLKTLAAMTQTEEIELETLAAMTQTEEIELETLAAMTQTEEIELETLAAMTQTEEIELETLAAMTQTEEIELETLAAMTQTEEIELETLAAMTQTEEIELETLAAMTQTEEVNDGEIISYGDKNKAVTRLTACATQTDENETCCDKNKVVTADFETQTDFHVTNVVVQNTLGIQTDEANKFGLYSGGDNAQNHCCVRKLNFETSFQGRPNETESFKFLDAKDYIDAATQTVGEFIRKHPKFVKRAQKLLKLKHDSKTRHIDKYRTVETQTDEMEPCANNNNDHCNKCRECNSTYNDNNVNNKQERDVQYANMVVKEMEAKLNKCEDNLNYLEKLVGQGKEKNEKQQALVHYLQSKIEILESSCEVQRDAINKIEFADTCCVKSQTEFEVTSTSTQADAPCPECNKASHRGLRRFFWEPLKCLFQLFAVVCFLGALSLLYGVSQRGRVRCDREPGATPWRWFDAQDVMDLLLRIEYTAEVPM